MALRNDLYRILDANFNRSKEGLRVCEDICRYVWDEAALSRGFKLIRHELNKPISRLGILKALENRDIEGDVGRGTINSESVRQNIKAVFMANCQRVKESLRVLEEIAKLIDAASADQVKKIRYKLYALEQSSLKKR